MCVYKITKIEVLEEDLVAYKFVRTSNVQDTFYSQFPEGGRSPQNKKHFDNSDLNLSSEEVSDYYFPQCTGSTFLYKIGEKTVSSFEDTPGIYCYASLEDMISVEGTYIDEYNSVLKVLIPKGTKIRRASSCIIVFGRSLSRKDTILTEELIPIEVVNVADLYAEIPYKRFDNFEYLQGA